MGKRKKYSRSDVGVTIVFDADFAGAVTMFGRFDIQKNEHLFDMLHYVIICN